MSWYILSSLPHKTIPKQVSWYILSSLPHKTIPKQVSWYILSSLPHKTIPKQVSWYILSSLPHKTIPKQVSWYILSSLPHFQSVCIYQSTYQILDLACLRLCAGRGLACVCPPLRLCHQCRRGIAHSCSLPVPTPPTMAENKPSQQHSHVNYYRVK